MPACMVQKPACTDSAPYIRGAARKQTPARSKTEQLKRIEENLKNKLYGTYEIEYACAPFFSGQEVNCCYLVAT